MLITLKKLIFGLDEFEKVKIDARFNELSSFTNSIKISKLEDFEILEECLYKLKEQLRIKSSNLNRIIKDNKNTLTKKEVINQLKILEEIKYDFLKNMFSKLDIKGDTVQILEENTISSLDSNLIEKKEYDLIINNGKSPYLTIKFKEKVDFGIIKQISSIFFDTYLMHGTNIIIEDSIVLIISRFQDDNLLSLPKIKSNLEDVYSKLKGDLNNEKNFEEKNSNDTDIKEAQYLEIGENQKLDKMSTKKFQEDSLDSLLSNIDSNDKKHTHKPNPKEDNIKIEFEKEEESIKFEKEESKEEIKIIKEDNNLKDNQFVVYQDQEIIAYFKQNSKVKGEFGLKHISNKKFAHLNESQLSYITIFSKIFSTSLFEILEAHGTNLIWEYESNELRIIPRYQEDKLKINWEPKSAQDEFLSQIRDKLLQSMQKEISKDESESKKEIKPLIEESEIKQRANHIIETIKRIP